MSNEQKAITVGPRIIKGRVHCANCGKYVDGKVYAYLGKDAGFVCNVQCGVDFIAKKERKARKTH